MEDVCFDDLVNDSLSSNDTVVLILLSHDYTKIAGITLIIGWLKNNLERAGSFYSKVSTVRTYSHF